MATKDMEKLLKEMETRLKKIVRDENSDLVHSLNGIQSSIDNLKKENDLLNKKLVVLQDSSDKLLAENILLKEIFESITRGANQTDGGRRYSHADMFNDSVEEGNENGSRGGAQSGGYALAVKRNSKNRNSASSYHLPTSNRFQLFQVMKEVATVEEKSHNAVIVGYPEQTDRDQATVDHDCIAISDFLLRAKVAPEDIIEIRRHGQKRDGRHRPLKVLTRSNEVRERIIRSFRALKPTDTPAGAYCRRDMTPTELAEDRRLKSLAYDLNCKEGVKKWTVRNLQMIELTGPNLEEFKPR
jgi:hypothetical protein